MDGVLEVPVLDAKEALELAGRLYGLSGGTVTEMVGYDDKNFLIRPDEVVGNPHMPSLVPQGCTLKVTNSLDTRDEGFIEGQTLLLSYLAEHGIKCPRPMRNKLGKVYSIEQLQPDGPRHAVRLLEFLPGDILGKVPWQDDFAVQAGRELAKINSVLDDADNPDVCARTTKWSLWRAPEVLASLDVVADAPRRTLVSEVIEAFQRETQTHADFLRRDTGIIHGDYNQFNILVARSEGESRYSLAGVIDFGDCHSAPRVFEVALCGTYMALTSGLVESVGDVLVGYSELRPLSEEAIKLVRVCVCARLCQSLVWGLVAHAQDPSNTYVLDSQKMGWQLLNKMWNVTPGTFEQQWTEALRMD